MKESVRAAESYVKSRSDDFGINSNYFNSKDIHVHVPEGATPKDGPSAGVAMMARERARIGLAASEGDLSRRIVAYAYDDQEDSAADT